LVLLVLRRNKAENKETATEVGAATAVIPTMPRGKATSGGLTKPLNWNSPSAPCDLLLTFNGKHSVLSPRLGIGVYKSLRFITMWLDHCGS
jgi:hypothetical protein